MLKYFRNPKNMGPLRNPSVVSTAGSPACGDMIRLYLRIVREGEEDRIEDISFESYGCAANIAAASILTELVKGKTLREAWSVSWRQISDALGGLPAIKYHCSILAVGALKRAIRTYYKEKPKPKWLPEELTVEERQTMEEEAILEKIYGAQFRADRK